MDDNKSLSCIQSHYNYIIFIQESLTSKVKEATGMGFRLEVHAIGDAAAEAVIKAFEDAHVSPEKRPLLTHAQVCIMITRPVQSITFLIFREFTSLFLLSSLWSNIMAIIRYLHTL